MNSTGTHCGRLLFVIGMTSLFDHFFKEKHCAVKKMGLVLKQLSCHFIKQEKKKMQPTAEQGDMKMNRRLSGSSSFSSTPRHPLTAAAVAQPTIPSTWVLEAGGGTMRAASPSNHVGGSWRCKCKLWPQHVHFGYYAMICHNMASKATIGVGEYIAMLDNVATKHTWHCNLQGGVTHGKDNRFMLFFQVLQSSGLCMWKSHVISQ